MYHKIRNTLAGMAVAVSMIGVSYTVGQPPQTPVGHIELGAGAFDAQADQGPLAQKRSQGMRRQMAMPYFSFGPLLPRRES